MDGNPYAITTKSSSVDSGTQSSELATTFDFAEVWGAAYGSADEELRVLWARLRDAWLRSKKGSDHTRRAYEKATGDWMAFVSNIRVSGRPLQLWEVTSGHVRLWQEELSSRLKASTVNQRLSACSSWYTFVINERGLVDGFEVSAFMDRSGKTRANPFASVTLSRDKVEQYGSARVLTLAEIHQLIEYLDRAVEDASEYSKATAARNRALLLAYLATGYRNNEVLQLRVGDIQPHKTVPGSWVVRWRGKGKKSRVEAFPGRVVKAINDYFAIAGRAVNPDEYIFVPMRTSQMERLGVAVAEGAHLTDYSARRILKKCVRRAGIEEWQSVRVHDLRHTFAHRFRANNPDLEALRARLHHESLATTGIYARAVLDEPVDDWSEGLF